MNDLDADCNLNIKSFAVPLDSLTPTTAREVEAFMDKEYPKQFTGFKKVAASITRAWGDYLPLSTLGDDKGGQADAPEKRAAG